MTECLEEMIRSYTLYSLLYVFLYFNDTQNMFCIACRIFTLNHGWNPSSHRQIICLSYVGNTANADDLATQETRLLGVTALIIFVHKIRTTEHDTLNEIKKPECFIVS